MRDAGEAGDDPPFQSIMKLLARFGPISASNFMIDGRVGRPRKRLPVDSPVPHAGVRGESDRRVASTGNAGLMRPASTHQGKAKARALWPRGARCGSPLHRTAAAEWRVRARSAARPPLPRAPRVDQGLVVVVLRSSMTTNRGRRGKSLIGRARTKGRGSGAAGGRQAVWAARSFSPIWHGSTGQPNSRH